MSGSSGERPSSNRTTAGQSRPARVARLPYLNTAPFYLRWSELEGASEGRWRSTVLPPRQLGLAAEAGEVDAGVMAVADLIRLEETFEPLVVSSKGAPVAFGIANWTRVESVFLFLRSRGPARTGAMGSGGSMHILTAEEAGECDGARIAITGETSTSFRLLRLLLEVRHGMRPSAYERMDLERFRVEGAGRAGGIDRDGIAGALVIGDTALRWRHRPPAGFYLAMDLASEWHAWTGLPFVFARWGVRRSLPAAHKEWLSGFLEESLRDSRDRLPELVQHLPEDLGPKSDLVDYLRNFTYELGPTELKAEERFRALLREYGISCQD